jgi:hypothetical protein
MDIETAHAQSLVPRLTPYSIRGQTDQSVAHRASNEGDYTADEPSSGSGNRYTSLWRLVAGVRGDYAARSGA